MTDQFIYCSITGATITPNGHEGFYFSDEYGKTYYLSALAWRMWDLLPQKGFTFTHLPKQLHTRYNWTYCGDPYGCLKMVSSMTSSNDGWMKTMAHEVPIDNKKQKQKTKTKNVFFFVFLP